MVYIIILKFVVYEPVDGYLLYAKTFHEQFIKHKTQNAMFPVLDWKRRLLGYQMCSFCPPPTFEELPTPLVANGGQC